MQQKLGIIKEFEHRILIDSTPDKIFEIISDHQNAPEWIHEVKKVIMLKSGEPKNGLGAIRRIIFKSPVWTNVDEEIIQYARNEEYTYKIISSMPGLIRHRGQWSLQPRDHKVEVTWKLYFEFKKYHWYRILLRIFHYSMRKFQYKALAKLKLKCEN